MNECTYKGLLKIECTHVYFIKISILNPAQKATAPMIP